MERLILWEYLPLKNQEPEIYEITKSIFIDGANENLKANYFTQEFWSELKDIQKEVKSEIQSLGEYKSSHLLQKEKSGESILYKYIMVFSKVRLLHQFEIDKNKKVKSVQTLSTFVMPNYFSMN